MHLSISLIAILIATILNSHTTHAQQLVATQSRARFPRTISGTSAILRDPDTVYILGGYGADYYTNSSDIFKFDITSDTIQLVATLPVNIRLGSASIDAFGNIYYIGGDDRQYNSRHEIYKFDPSTNTVEEVASLPSSNQYSALVTSPEDLNVAFILGGKNDRQGIVAFNMVTLTTERVGDLVVNHSSLIAVSDGSGSAFIFGNNGSATNPTNPVTKLDLSSFTETYGPPTFPKLVGGWGSASAWDGRYAYIIGNYADQELGFYTDSILRFDPETMETAVLRVSNFPVSGSRQYSGASAVFVESLNRIYIFAGTWCPIGGSICESFDRIWYIDLPERPTVPTTEEPTSTTPSEEPILSTTTTQLPISTTINPDIFTCTDKPDGMYPHPYDCEKFINCNAGNLTEFRCPAPLIFDPVTRRCELPELVDCEISCLGKPNEMFPHPHDCALFIYCLQEQVNVFRCPPPLLFDGVNRRCDIPENVECLVV
ncbi:putative chitinase 3 [Folsomia candida]|uniref:Putative chitinase 3 n=1 Tax=Folsomia candida TaxID=158441 RepID=A0A226DK26_FOLCA|nr:putative chitinase 3 [Folsomia candida]